VEIPNTHKSNRLTPADERSAFRQFLGVIAGIALLLGLAFLLGRPLVGKRTSAFDECQARYAAARTFAESAAVDNVYPQYGTDIDDRRGPRQCVSLRTVPVRRRPPDPNYRTATSPSSPGGAVQRDETRPDTQAVP